MNHVRTTVDSVLARARADQALLEQLRRDPASVLAAAGIPPELAAAAAMDLALPGEDVSGLMRCNSGFTWLCDVTGTMLGGSGA